MRSLLDTSRERLRKLLAALQLTRPQVQSLDIGYEKAGLTVRREPIPWNAEVVLVDALVHLADPDIRTKDVFRLCLPGHSPARPVALQAHAPDLVSISFRLPPLPGPTWGVLCGQGRELGRVRLPYLAKEEFLAKLTLAGATLFAQLGPHLVPCQAFLQQQCRGLMAAGMLSSPTSLLPVMDLALGVEFTDHAAGRKHWLPLALAASQLTSRQTLLAATPPGWPCGSGPWSASWLAGDQPLASALIRALSPTEFRQSLYMIDGRYFSEEQSGAASFLPYPPGVNAASRLGPCFRVAAREPGAAGLCRLEIHTKRKNSTQPSDLLEQELLVTDGPARLMPPAIAAADFHQVAGFDMLFQGKLLGTLAGACGPAIRFTSEGGFESRAGLGAALISDQELADRLARLMASPDDSLANW